MKNPQGYERTCFRSKLVFKSDKNPRIGFAKAEIETPSKFKSDDLQFVSFVLASEHENANGDYLSRSEIIKAKNTPINKPFNVEHMVEEDGSYISQALFNKTQNTIIGHMVSTAILDKTGNSIEGASLAKLDREDDPKRSQSKSIDIMGSAVLYEFLFPRSVGDIKTLSEEGEMFVSMEAWFKGFDFLLGNEIVPFEENEHLLWDWHNKKEVDGRRVSRVLKNVLFGGVAATKTPANKESVFITASEKRFEDLNKRHDELHILYSINPSDELEAEHTEVTRAIASIKERIGDEKQEK